MICVTGDEGTAEGLRRRQEELADAGLHELRLDLLDEPETPLDELVVHPLPRLVVTCRPTSQGGGYGGDESLRLEILERAARAGAGFVDLEADVEPARADHLLDVASMGPTRVIRSHHEFEPGADVSRLGERLRALRGHVLKLAVAVEDAAHLAPLRALGSERDRPVLLIGMGPAGLLSRVCHRRFGSAWTYVAARAGAETASGQITWAQAKAWGLAAGKDPAPVALLGGPQVFGSPGPAVYNRLFAASGVPLVYVPVQTSHAPASLALLRQLGFAGASVTMPLKEQVAESLDSLDDGAAAAGAVNTVTVVESMLVGSNTDGPGAARAIEGVRPLAGCKLLLLGAGGAGRAVAWAAARVGAEVSVWNRTAERARRLADDLGVSAVSTIEGQPFDVLVNSTSVGLHGDDSPLADPSILTGKVLLECVGQPVRTKLVRDAESVGATVLTGRDLWLEQGALQASQWLDREVTSAELRDLL